MIPLSMKLNNFIFEVYYVSIMRMFTMQEMRPAYQGKSLQRMQKACRRMYL